MKFKTLDGKIIGVDIRPSRWPRKSEEDCKSHFQFRVGEYIDEAYPGEVVLEEFYPPRMGFYIDFFLPRRKIAIEADGAQHERFNVFFHGNRDNFLKAKARDTRKNMWCEINDIRLVRIRPGEDKEDVVNKLKSDD